MGTCVTTSGERVANAQPVSGVSTKLPSRSQFTAPTLSPKLMRGLEEWHSLDATQKRAVLEQYAAERGICNPPKNAKMDVEINATESANFLVRDGHLPVRPSDRKGNLTVEIKATLYSSSGLPLTSTTLLYTPDSIEDLKKLQPVDLKKVVDVADDKTRNLFYSDLRPWWQLNKSSGALKFRGALSTPIWEPTKEGERLQQIAHRVAGNYSNRSLELLKKLQAELKNGHPNSVNGTPSYFESDHKGMLSAALAKEFDALKAGIGKELGLSPAQTSKLLLQVESLYAASSRSDWLKINLSPPEAAVNEAKQKGESMQSHSLRIVHRNPRKYRSSIQEVATGDDGFRVNYKIYTRE